MLKYFDKNQGKLLRQGKIGDLNFQITSDNHINPNNTNLFINQIIENKKTNILFLLGDIIDNKNGIDLTDNINYILKKLSSEFEYIFYTPGNHDLRGKKELFKGFYSNKNIFMASNEDLIVELYGKKILLLNTFFDINFFNQKIKNILEITNYEIYDFYKKIPDGKLNNLKIEKNNSKDLSKIDIIISHTMQYPIGIKIKTITEKGESIKKLQEKLKQNNIKINYQNLNTIYKKEEKLRNILPNYGFKIEQFNDFNIKEYQKLGINFLDYIKGIKLKASILGTNIFENNSFKNGVVSFYGHYHSYENYHLLKKDGKKIHFLSNTIH